MDKAVEKAKQDNYQYGIALLKVFMCFLVVCKHFWHSNECGYFLGKELLLYSKAMVNAVFMILTFLFCEKGLSTNSVTWIQKRMERLIVPQIAWTFVYGLVLYLLYIVFRTDKIAPADIFWQLFLGHSEKVNPTMWFQVVLIWITVLFMGVIKVFPRIHNYVLFLIGVAALLAEYSGVTLFLKQYRYELQYPLGRFVEMIPLAVFGFMTSRYELLPRLKKERFVTGILSIIIITIDYNWCCFSTTEGFGTTGVKPIIIGGCFVILAYCFPIENMPDRFKVLLSTISRFTMGIYCSHRLVAKLLHGLMSKYNVPIEKGSIQECIVIYVIAYLCCWFGYELFRNTRIKRIFE